MRPAFRICCVALFAALVHAEERPPWERASYDPPWASVKHSSEYRLEYRDDLGDALNAKRLMNCLTELKAGERLLIGPGTWSLKAKTDITAVGTANKPIWIEALDPKRPPVLTRPDAKQNVLNLGESGPVRYLVLRNLEVTGGSTLIRIGDGKNVWIDRCHLHDGQGEGITANFRDTSRLYLTRNHIHGLKHARATGEGMYLGANHGKRRMSYSVIALNHIHDCAGEQGDGIEVKQGSHHNWIVENHVHDTKYPCILVYGTGGNGINLIERNTCYRSQDNVMQIQGEAIVRNNLVVSGEGAAFASHDHQGKVSRLTVVHNTFVNDGTVVRFARWNDREGMVFANNAVYSRAGAAIRWRNAVAGGVFVGNVVVGQVVGAEKGFARGAGLRDFVDLAWDGSRRDARPSPGGKLDAKAAADHATNRDLSGKERKPHAVPGAFQPAPEG